MVERLCALVTKSCKAQNIGVDLLENKRSAPSVSDHQRPRTPKLEMILSPCLP